MIVRDRAREVLRWITTRSPRALLFTGWIVFMLGSYPGYMTVDSIRQLSTVRSGDYTDYSPVMTALWGLLEYVVAGPFPMLALQSGLFLFGLYAILRTLLTPRAAAVTAAAVLLFPPVFAPMAVIWPDPLMAGAILGGVGAMLDERRAWKIAGAVLFAIACACHLEAIVAIVPLVWCVVPTSIWWRRAAIAVGITLGLGASSMIANRVLTVSDTYLCQQRLMLTDIVGSVRRAKVHDEAVLHRAFAGLPLADTAPLGERMALAADANNWALLSMGDKRIFELVHTDEQADALSAAWRRTIVTYPGAYLSHRWTITRAILGISGKWSPVTDDFGNPDLMVPLHHRAIASDWQYGMQRFVRAVALTPLFRPWLYLVLAIVAIVLARRHALLRAFVISGLVRELAMTVLAPNGDYRNSHWLVTTTCIVLAALAVARKQALATPPAATVDHDG